MKYGMVYLWITVIFTIALLTTALLGFYTAAYIVLFGYIVVSVAGMVMWRMTEVEPLAGRSMKG